MDRNRKFTFDILMIVRDNPVYVKRMREAQKQLGIVIADRAVEGHRIMAELVFAYNYFKERAYL